MSASFSNSHFLPVLQQDFARLQTIHMRDLFAQDPLRVTRYSLSAATLFLDYSKNRIDEAALDHLIELAAASGLGAARDAMFTGQPINNTEDRAVLHTALRYRGPDSIWADGADVMPGIREQRQRIVDCARAVRSGEWRGATGQVISDVVNIGIGGSDLGPAMVTQALAPYGCNGPKLHFVSNVDPVQISDILAKLDPACTLFIVASKTFTTQETLTNAVMAKRWLLAGLAMAEDDSRWQRHMLAVTARPNAAKALGYKEEHIFCFWDWVGGRYSLWSAVGLPIAMAIGPEGFDELLAGAEEMDAHFRSAPLKDNMPVILAVLGVWYRQFFNSQSHTVLPYSQRLARLPAYLQQLDMESNGKSLKKDGTAVSWASGPVIWGEPGTNGQHAFYQLIHQGVDLIPCDFLVARECESPEHVDQHQILVANAVAQAEALMCGKSEQQVRDELAESSLSPAQEDLLVAHKSMPGNRPSNFLILPRLCPKVLGSLIALYEHKVFCQGVIWGLNSFDQWGVELGKQLASQILSEMRDDTATAVPHDPSTNALLVRLRGGG
ncbi:glucose-6-phosphate isomerase [Zhongshania sp.]|uniref:glucose-6-phosphate isomerase n=1 Tax=Zhongshania sp. TaxID=1971902 RepID=UPI003566F026